MVAIEFSSNHALLSGGGAALNKSIEKLAKPSGPWAFRMAHVGSLINYQLVGKLTLKTVAMGFTFVQAPQNEADRAKNPQYVSIYGCCPACRPTTPLGAVSGDLTLCGNCGGRGANFGRTMLMSSAAETVESIIVGAMVETGMKPVDAAFEANMVANIFFTALEAHEFHLLRLREPGRHHGDKGFSFIQG